MNYSVEDCAGHVLFANQGIWIDVLNTIPGFMHGVQGMCIGEKRTLFIHPSLAYGVLTTLPPGSLLVVHIEMLAVDDSKKISLPPLTSLDLTWVQDEKLFQALEQSVFMLPSYVGGFYRHLFQESDLF